LRVGLAAHGLLRGDIWPTSTPAAALIVGCAGDGNFHVRRVKASFDPANLFNPGKVFYA
jgi:hypothetical protein